MSHDERYTRHIVWFTSGVAVGVAVGFVAGTRAGRRPYDEMLKGARRVWENPRVQDAAQSVQTRAARVARNGMRRFSPDGTSRITESDMLAAEEAA
jgi:hypothetical protein